MYVEEQEKICTRNMVARLDRLARGCTRNIVLMFLSCLVLSCRSVARGEGRGESGGRAGQGEGGAPERDEGAT